MASQQQGRRRAIWLQLLALICLSCSVVMSQTVGDDSSDAGSNNNSVGPPSTTTPATTPVTAVSATTFPPSTTAPAASTETPTTITNTPTASTVLSSSGSASETSTPTSTTKAPATTTSPTATKTTAPTTTPSATADPDTSSAATTAAPVVKQYNSSTLPPSVSSSVLNGSDLVNVEVTETTLGNGSTSFDYIIVTSSGETEKVIVLSPETMDPTSSNYSEAASDQSGSSRSDRNTSNSSGSLGLGTIIGIIVGVLVFLLALVVFLIVQHRRRRNQSIEMPSDTILAAVEKQMQLQDRGQSLVDTEYEESTRTFGYSQVSGAPLSGSRRHRATLWEHPVIVASRIPVDHIELGEIISHGAFGMVYRGRFRYQDVAIKTLLPEKRKDMAHIQLFLSEVKLMATMEHPNIVKFIGVAWESLSELYCVSEFMSGGDLRSLLQDYLATGAPQGMDTSKMQIAYDVAVFKLIVLWLLYSLKRHSLPSCPF
ncbi:hypothetical protein PC116_g6995 [Phytophthora cactorum]|nr:hypothetical protein PC116_g6995 [Phytophthora cactorum]